MVKRPIETANKSLVRTGDCPPHSSGVRWNIMTKDTQRYFEELKAHLPMVKDPTVIILRGHLLIENLLDQLIAANLTNANAIQNARLTFFQKLCLAKGIVGSSSEDGRWKPIEELNKLRNMISHNLPDETMCKKLDPVLRALFPGEFGGIPNDTHSKSKALRKGIIFECAVLLGLIEGMEYGKRTSNQTVHRIADKSGSQ